MKISRWIDTEFDNVECPHLKVDGTPESTTIFPGEEYQHVSWIHPLIASVFDAARERWDSPILVTSGIRCQAYQEVLRKKGLRTAEVSPHVYGVALDIQSQRAVDRGIDPTLLVHDSKRIAELIHKVDPGIRIFCARYAFKFVHMDAAYLIPDPLPDGRPKPESWKAGVRDFP